MSWLHGVDHRTTAYLPISRYLTPRDGGKLKNSLKSFGSLGTIVDPTQDFDVAEAFGSRLRVPVACLVGVVEQWRDRESGPVHTGDLGIWVTHNLAVLPLP